MWDGLTGDTCSASVGSGDAPCPSLLQVFPEMVRGCPQISAEARDPPHAIGLGSPLSRPLVFDLIPLDVGSESALTSGMRAWDVYTEIEAGPYLNIPITILVTVDLRSPLHSIECS